MAIYYFLIGIPGSGKSTFVDSLGCEIVCPDDLRVKYRLKSIQAFEWARKLVKDALVDGKDVAFDATHTVERWRQQDILAGRQHANKVIAIWMVTPLELCKERNDKRERKVPERIINRMHFQLGDNQPKLSEGFDEIWRIMPDGTVLIEHN